MTPDDSHYIQLVLEGNTRAFSVLVDRYKDMVFTLTCRMLKNREDAEDVAQEVFVKAYKSFASFKGKSKFSTWVYKIAYFACLDYLRNAKNIATVDLNTYGENSIQSADNVLAMMEEKEREHLVKTCINLLPGDESFLVTLYYFEDKSLDEISEIVGLKSNHLKVKIFRIRQKLAQLLHSKVEPEILEPYERRR